METEKRKIMLVDDNIISMMVTADILSAHGYAVVQTTSPNGCVAKLDYESPDVLLVDVTMPRLAFDDLVRNIQSAKEHANLIVVLFSSGDPQKLEQMCMDKDIHGYFCKEMDVTRLPEYVDYFF
jgi:CheY-like chemotaxis protein